MNWRDCYKVRCKECRCDGPLIAGDGPVGADVMFIGEAPGEKEYVEEGGRPFMGRVGDEFNYHYLRLAGLDREDVFFTNTMKCKPKGKKPSEKEWEGCAGRFVKLEVENVVPRVIVLMGATACKLVPGLNLDVEAGMPREVEGFMGGWWSGLVMPMMHPAFGMHDTSKMVPLMEGFERLGRVVNGKWAWGHESGRKERRKHVGLDTDYRLVETLVDVEREFDRYAERRKVGGSTFAWSGIDTETHGPDPFSVQFSLWPGHGRMVLWGKTKAEHERCREVLRELGDHMRWGELPGGLLLHNAGQDEDELVRMGMGLDGLEVRDTMQECFRLGNVPQGLKAVVYQQLGVRMKGWDELVRPVSRDKFVEWCVEAAGLCEAELREKVVKKLKTKTKVEWKKTKVEARLLAISKEAVNKQDYEPWKALKEMWSTYDIACAMKEYLEERLGPVPILGIGNCKLDKAIEYGCGDADMTGRLGEWLVEERKRRTGKGSGGKWEVRDESDEDDNVTKVDTGEEG